MKLHALILAMVLALLAQHSSAHSAHAFNFGEPGRSSSVTKTYRFQLNDSMRFVTKDTINIRQGDTVRFEITNTGRLPHEFSLGDVTFQQEHAAMMKAMPDMKHTDPNTVSVAPGKTQTLIWRFSKRPPSGMVQIGCHVLGHYDAGMKYDLIIRP